MDTKECRKCHREKQIDEFYAQKRRKDGKHPWCKTCCKEHQKKTQKRRNERERERWASDTNYRNMRLKIQRNWIKKNIEHKRKYERERRKENPEEYRRRFEKYAKKHPEEIKIMARARQRIYRAIKNGSLHRPNKCEWCGVFCKPEAAHEDYDKPLEIKWLCRPCHAKWDYHEPKIMGKRNVAT